MISKFSRLIILSWALFFLSSQTTAVSAEEAGNSRSGSTKGEISAVVKAVMREIDPAALISIKTTQAVSDSKWRMPGTPFSLDNLDINSKKMEPTFGSVEVVIYATTGSLPDKSKDLIRELLGSYAKNIIINVKKLPTEFLAARDVANSPTAKEKVKPWESSFSDVLTRMSGLIRKGEGLVSEDMVAHASRAAYVALIAGIMVMVLTLVLGVLWFWMQRNILSAIERGFSGVAAALENGVASGTSKSMVSNVEPMLTRRPPTQLGAAGVVKNFASIPEDSLFAILSDCYWSGADQYGAFIWRRISMERKIGFIARMSALSEYGRYVAGLEEEDLGMEQDPGYLQPLPLWHLDMQSLTDVVRKHPGLITKLSPLRLGALRLKPTERLALYDMSRQVTFDKLPALPDVKCEPRELQTTLRIEIQSEADELEILKMKERPFELIEQVPSLGWLLELPEETIKDIFQPLSAKDIALAWVGPKEILDRLGSLLGEKKFEIMKSYLARLSPSRESQSFLAIHSRVLAELRRSKDAPTDKVLEHAA